MVYFLFGFCFCLSLDRIIEWVRVYIYDHRRNHRSYPRYHNYYETDYRNLGETWAIHNIRSRLNNLEDQWNVFKEKYPDMFEEDEESEEEDI